MDNSKDIIIDVEPISRRIVMNNIKTSILNFFLENDISINTLCGGVGKCGKCRIIVKKGSGFLNKLTDSENRILNNEDIEDGIRLACQLHINNDLYDKLIKIKSPQLVLYLDDKSIHKNFKILTSGLQKEIEINPIIEKIFLDISKPSLESPIPDEERIIESIKRNLKRNSLNSPISVNLNVLKKLPTLLREHEHKLTFTLYNKNMIIDCEPGNTTKNIFGIAFDIGTTTIVGYLINLNDGKTYSISSKMNPQTQYGEDLISRLTFIKKNENGLNMLNTIVINTLNEIINENCLKSNIYSNQIYESTIVGNSVMHHIFLDINPISIGLSPYIPVVQHAQNFSPTQLKLNINREGNVYILPIVAGFVGADTIGVILSSELYNEPELTLAIDVGTNGEIIIGNKDILVVGSCAAGSALEGAHIRYGMRAASGAIERIKINPHNFEIDYKTINNKDPIGICGSGLIDAIAEMLKCKIITRNGNFNKKLIKNDRFKKIDNNIEYILVKKEENPLKKEITLSQKDIREIQMAKAAFYSGSQILLNYVEMNKEIEQIFLAGAFGNYINKVNAKFIGMIPDIPDENIYQIGNAAGIGAQHCLLNQTLRQKAEELLKKIKYIEIATKKEFQKEYAEAMYFPHYNLNNFPSLKNYRDISLR